MDVLFVDDEKGLLDQAKIFLEREEGELEVDTAISAEEGLEKFEEERYDAIVSDYQMPGMDGLEFLAAVRKDQSSDIPFIIFTGKGREEVAIEALNLGADRYLQKGGDPKSQYKVLLNAVKQEVEHYETKKDLETRKEQFEKAVQNAPYPVMLHAENGDVISVNDIWTEITGYTKEEISTIEEWTEKAYGEDKNKVKPRIEELYEEEGRSTEGIYTITTKAGEKRHWDFSSTSLGELPDGRRLVMSMAHDITEKKRAEEELRGRERKYRELFNTALFGITVHDSRGNIIAANKKAEKIFDMSEDELISTDMDFWLGKLLRPDGNPMELSGFPLSKVDRTEEPSEGNIVGLSMSEDEQTRWFLHSARPILDEEGSIEKVITCFVDITEEREKELEKEKVKQQLQEAVMRFRRISEISPYAIILVDQETGEITDANRAAEEIIGSDREDIIGREYLTIHPEVYRERVQEIFDEEDPSFSSEYDILNAEGERVPVEIRTSTLELGSKSIRFLALNDISKRKEAEEREEFLHSLLRHDLKNKMQISKGFLQLLEEADLEERYDRSVEKALDSFEEGMEIIEKVRKVRGIEQDVVREIDIDEEIGKTIEEYRAEAEEHGMKISLELPENRTKVKGGDLLSEVFSNLVGNCIEHSGGHEIKVSCQETDGEVLCTLEDDGEGIPTDQMDEVFNRGYTTCEDSSGLGLFLVKEIIEKYGGSIEVRGSDLGGARFDVHLQKV